MTRSRIVQRDGLYWQADEPPFSLPPEPQPADEPHTWAESWWFIGPALVVAVVIYAVSAWGWL
ncbi:MAG TPA: hypothetical protein VFP92_10665 [Rhodanobacteraceae bacterium]|nr:hypothetical protein [Rhodanobacteraceae bacterium]